jgi:hypothetical protein
MAKSTSRPPKKPTPISLNTPFDGPPDDTSAAEPQETDLSSATPEESAEPPTARPPISNPVTTRGPKTFIQTMNTVPKGDWGARANIYLYRVEPIIDRTRSGEKKFINIYAEPLTEDRVMADYGSGRYKLILNFRKPGAETGDVIDSDYMDILNMKYPPKIPLGEWTDDPRNKKWAWAKEANGIPTGPAPAPSSSGLEAVVDVMRATSEMRRDIREELQASTPPTPPTPPAAPDPFDTAAKIMAMRANDPMTTVLMGMIDAAHKEAEASRLREYELQKELRQQSTTATAAEKPKTLMEQLTDFKALKDLFSGTGNGAVETVRAGRTGVLDVFQTLGTKFFESDLATGVGQWLGAMAQRSVASNGTPPQMNNPSNAMQPTQTEQQQFAQFIELTLNPALRRFYSQGMGGADFAGWLYDAFPERLTQLQNFTHPLAPGMKGASVIVAAYKRTPEMWNLIQAQREGEPSFVQFVNEFCRWKPEDSEHDGAIDAEIVRPDGDSDEERIS